MKTNKQSRIVRQASRSPARIDLLKVENYRALKHIELKDITPLTVLLGPNGSGKSTLFDVFSFLSECFQDGLRRAWDRRSGLKEMRTRGQSGPVIIEIVYREGSGLAPITYHLSIDERLGKPVVVEEWLRWKREPKAPGAPFKFLDYKQGKGQVISGETPDQKGRRVKIPLRSSDQIAVSTLGRLADHPRVAALREFITDWYISYLSVDDTRKQPEAGPQERLSKTGDNLPNVIQYLKDQHPDRLSRIDETLTKRVPRLERVVAKPMADGRLLLQIKDAPFKQPILSRYSSDGTLKMLAYLTLLYDPNPPQFIGIEEPENFLHPLLLPELAEECRTASALSQLFVTTHSPFFLNSMKPDEVRVLYRDERGYTQAVRASDLTGINEFMAEGALLGDLWLEGHFGVGNPLVNSGAPVVGAKS